MRLWSCLSFLTVLPVLALSQIRSAKYHNRDVWQIENDRLRVSVTQVGAHIAEIVLKDVPGINPLWLQDRPTIDPTGYVPEKHEKLYGGGSSARLMSGIMGHNLCFPYWGDPSESEYQAGMTFHGETGVVRWKKLSERRQSNRLHLTLAAGLPESNTRFTRTLSLVAGEPVVYFENRAENMTALDRPVGWCEHVTVGPPFLKKGLTLFDASLTRGRKIGDASGEEFRWPNGQAETEVDLRTVRDIEKSGFVNNFLVDPSREFGYFTAVNAEQHLLIGYLFRRTDFPWLNLWEANQPSHDGQPAMLARGLEFSNTPTHGSLKALVAAPSVFGTPAYEWLNARSSLVKNFCAFIARVPDGFRGVQNINVGEKSLAIVEMKDGRVVTVPFDRSFIPTGRR
jgi:hypothetical protein